VGRPHDAGVKGHAYADHIGVGTDARQRVSPTPSDGRENPDQTRPLIAACCKVRTLQPASKQEDDQNDQNDDARAVSPRSKAAVDANGQAQDQENDENDSQRGEAGDPGCFLESHDLEIMSTAGLEPVGLARKIWADVIPFVIYGDACVVKATMVVERFGSDLPIGRIAIVTVAIG
jgi:hypothetical protein